MKKIILAIALMACISFAGAQSVVFDSVFIMNSATDSIITAVQDFDELYLAGDSVLGNAASSSIWVVLSPNDLKTIDLNYKCFLRLEKDGVTLRKQTETNPPYALYGDDPNTVPIDFFDGVNFHEGQYMLVVALINGAGGPLVDGTDSVYINFDVIDDDPPVSIGEQTAKNTFEIYPNPVTSNLTVKTGNGISQISITNLVGQEILNLKNINEQQYTIDLSRLAGGIYIISIVESNNKVKVHKLIKR